jgi:hypothetical protein
VAPLVPPEPEPPELDGPDDVELVELGCPFDVVAAELDRWA